MVTGHVSEDEPAESVDPSLTLRVTMTNQRRVLAALTILAISTGGCDGGGPAPVGLSGTVTLDGKPVPEGSILFEPVDETAGQRRDVAIRNGEFTLPASEGLLPGLEFKVIIKAFKKTGQQYPSPYPNESYDEVVQYLPAAYNSASTLRVIIPPDGDENPLKFDLVSR